MCKFTSNVSKDAEAEKKREPLKNPGEGKGLLSGFVAKSNGGLATAGTGGEKKHKEGGAVIPGQSCNFVGLKRPGLVEGKNHKGKQFEQKPGCSSKVPKAGSGGPWKKERRPSVFSRTLPPRSKRSMKRF